MFDEPHPLLLVSVVPAEDATGMAQLTAVSGPLLGPGRAEEPPACSRRVPFAPRCCCSLSVRCESGHFMLVFPN